MDAMRRGELGHRAALAKVSLDQIPGFVHRRPLSEAVSPMYRDMCPRYRDALAEEVDVER
jgi:hypothetical protein